MPPLLLSNKISLRISSRADDTTDCRFYFLRYTHIPLSKAYPCSLEYWESDLSFPFLIRWIQ